MTLEQKAKAYDEAIEKAKDMLSYGEIRREDMECLFPSLIESEEDRISVAITRFLLKNGKYAIEMYGCTIKEATDWLEKQRKPKWTEEDEKNLQGIIDEIQANKSNAPEYDLKTYDRFLSWLKLIKLRLQ